MTDFKVYDLVKCNSTSIWGGTLEASPTFQVIYSDGVDGITIALYSDIQKVGGIANIGGKCWSNRYACDLSLILTNNKGENMKQAIVNLFEKSKDAALIEKHFGSRINNIFDEILLNGKQEQLLKAAKELEKVEIEEEE